MTASAETIEKLNSLDQQYFDVAIQIINQLYDLSASSADDDNIFRIIRESGKDHWMSDEEIDQFMEDYRIERRAARH